MIRCRLKGGFDTGRGNINAGHLETKRCQNFTVPAFAAGYIQHPGTGNRPEVPDQGLYKRICLLFVPLKIQFVVVNGIEPVLVPCFFGHAQK